MLDVFFTVDVEVWCGGWVDIEKKFPKAFDRYVYGRTRKGNFGLPYQLLELNNHGLKGVFFVEPLFATRFGIAPLSEITGLIHESGHEIQLHLHTEWVDEARCPLIENIAGKKQFLHYFNLEDQIKLIATGLKLINDSNNAIQVNAFRAGSFAFNRDTLRALSSNGITFDSSYNASTFGPSSGVMTGQILVEPTECENVHEYPMTVYNDGTKSLRHTQLTACSTREMEGLLWKALENERKSFVILSHNFELLNADKTQPDELVIRRFRQLCSFLDRHRDCFRVRGFQELTPHTSPAQPPPLSSPLWRTGLRFIEQIYRRRYS